MADDDTSIWPNSETDAFWVGPIVTVVLALALWRVGQLITTRISFDIVENCDVSCMKESVKNNWTNMAVTAALLLSMIVGMLQIDTMESTDYTLEAATMVHLRQFYICFCMASACCNLVAVFYCIIYLSFVDPLNQIDVMKYLLTYPDSLGDPVVWLLEGVIFFWLATCTWVFASYGGVMLICSIMFFGLFATNLTWTALTRSRFCPDEMDWKWTQNDPNTWKEQQNYLNRNLTKNAEIIKQVQKIGRYITEADAQKSAPQSPATGHVSM